MAAGDPYHEQIVNGLGGKLDPNVFEPCMGDVLRDVFPGLVPVVGGSDSGFDAAIPDGEGEPSPLACTTAAEFSKIKKNLLGSLAAARRKAWFRGRIALATSAVLTPHQRHELFDAVRAVGAVLLQVFDRQAIADRLYRHPDWCTRLLQLPERVRALSVVPESLRRVASAALIGRNADLEWLRTTGGDRLLHGQPGSGKTFLLRHIVDEGDALFLVVDDQAAVASNLRELQPAAVIVDDAHVYLARIDLLRRLREELGHQFDIIATCWPREVDDLVHRLGGVASSHVRELELLTRDEIVELFEKLEVNAHPDVMRELVTQAANKPGLAVVIAQSWLAGDSGEVWNGEVLRREVVASFRQQVGPNAEEVLAAFALGGDAGMPIDAVAEYLGEPERAIRLAAVALTAGGVLSEVASRTLSVSPDALRSALLRRAFFPEGPRRTFLRPLDDILVAVPRFESAVLEIVRCARTGGRVAPGDLRDLVIRAQAAAPRRSLRVWREAALIDGPTATWVVEHYPGDVVDVAREALFHAASLTTMGLLQAAERSFGEIHNLLDHPLRVISDWCRSFRILDEAESLQRRRLLLTCVRQYLDRGGNADIALRASFLALDPSLEAHHLDPGVGKTFTMRWQILSAESLAKLLEFWGHVRPLALSMPIESWPQISQLLWSCAHPDGIHPTPVSEESRAALRNLGQVILRDVVGMANGHPGLAARLGAFAVDLGADLSFVPDPTFEILFPTREDDDTAEQDQNRVERIAAEWATRLPADVALDLAHYEVEQRFVPHRRENLLPQLCREISRRVDAPDVWTAELLREGKLSNLLALLVARCVRERSRGTIDVLDRCLAAPSLAWIGVDGALQIDDLPDTLLARALEEALRFPDHVETLCSQRHVPISTLQRLLTSDHVLLRVAAVSGEWLAQPRKQVRSAIRDQWNAAIVRTSAQELDALRQSSSLEFWLGEILRSEPELSLEWLRSLFPSAVGRLRMDGPVAAAIDGLEREQRIALVPALTTLNVFIDAHEIPAHLVNGDDEVYRSLLATDAPRAIHLAPLRDPTRPEWPALARRALEAGCDPQEIAESSLDVSEKRGDDTARLNRFLDAFRGLRSEDSPELADVAREGERIVGEQLAKASALARQQALHGI